MHRAKILNNNSIGEETATVKVAKPPLYGEDVKMVSKISQKQKILTPTERDEIAAKYQSGLNMAEIARLYGCHYTTIGRILRKKGVEIRV